MSEIDLPGAMQIVANIGVLTGIAFLAYELRQNTQATNLVASQHYLSNSFAIDLRIAESPELAELLTKAARGDELRDADRLRLSRLSYAGLRHWENIHYLHTTSVLDERFWPPVRRELIKIMSVSPFMVEQWSDNKASFTDQFNEEMESMTKAAIGETDRV